MKLSRFLVPTLLLVAFASPLLQICQGFAEDPNSVRGSAATTSPERTGDASKPFQQLKPPVTLKVTAIAGKGKERKADIVVKNSSGRTIEKMIVDMYFLKKDGTVGKSVPHTNNFAFEDGESKTIKVTSFFMEEDTSSIGGVVSGLKFADGSDWPAVPAKIPAKKGKEPVAAEMIGLVGSGNMIKPAVACYNHSAKGVKGVNYRIEYLDANGKVLERTGYGYSAGDPFMEPGKGKVIRGGKGPPKGASEVRVKMGTVSFGDGSKWKP